MPPGSSATLMLPAEIIPTAALLDMKPAVLENHQDGQECATDRLSRAAGQ
jgi:hypothetical protein